MKPSPSRRHLFTKMNEANREIMKFVMEQVGDQLLHPPMAFIDIHNKMLNANGQPSRKYF
jgi:hypothetical protein